MSSFTEPLAFAYVSKNKYITTESFRFYFKDDLTGEYVDIPKGTIFNGASIPKLIQKIFRWNPIDFRWLQATVLHDALVGEHGVKVKTSTGRTLSWNESADWFDAALRVKRDQYSTCPKLHRRLFVTSVRIYPTFKRLF